MVKLDPCRLHSIDLTDRARVILGSSAARTAKEDILQGNALPIWRPFINIQDQMPRRANRRPARIRRLRVVPSAGYGNAEIAQVVSAEMSLFYVPGKREIASVVGRTPHCTRAELAARTRSVAVAHLEVRSRNLPCRVKMASLSLPTERNPVYSINSSNSSYAYRFANR